MSLEQKTMCHLLQQVSFKERLTDVTLTDNGTLQLRFHSKPSPIEVVDKSGGENNTAGGARTHVLICGKMVHVSLVFPYCLITQ